MGELGTMAQNLYGPRVRIGNWNEDVYLEEVKIVSNFPFLLFSMLFWFPNFYIKSVLFYDYDEMAAC